MTKHMSDTEAVADKVMEKLANVLAGLDMDNSELHRIATSMEVSPTPEQRLRLGIARLLTRR